MLIKSEMTEMSAGSPCRSVDKGRFLSEGWFNLVTHLKVKLMRAEDQKELMSREERANLTQTEKLGGS